MASNFFPSARKGLKHINTLTFLLFALSYQLAGFAVESPSHRQVIYVSSKGNDLWGDGSIDKPFYSINKALKGNLKDGPSSDTLYITVNPGVYFMSEPIQISESNSRPVVVTSSSTREKPIFIGGIQIKGWQNKNGILQAYIPETVQYGFKFNQLFVNHQRATLARTPNEKWFKVKASKETPIERGENCAKYAVQQIDLFKNDFETVRKSKTDDIGQIKFRFYHKWDITCKKPRYISTDSSRIYMDGTGMKPWNPINKDSRYIMFDYLAALDSINEWYLDSHSGILYYKPEQEESMDSLYCIVPTLRQWLIIRGDRQRHVRNITFKGISFQYSSYKIPELGEDPMQAAAKVDAAIQLDYADHIVFEDCEMLHTGNYAVSMSTDCHHNTIRHCYMEDLGAGGIKVGEPYMRKPSWPITSNNIIDNNIIKNAGHELPCAVGIGLFFTKDNQITHNDISDILYTGISVGWFWGYNKDKASASVMDDNGDMVLLEMPLKNPSTNNLIQYNHIHHIGWGELSDMGGIYTLGESPGTKILNNIINDVWSYDYGGWGLYADEGSTGIEMRNNLVVRCKSGGFHQHYGKENIIENNIFAFGYIHQLQLTRAEPHLSLHFKHNIVIYDKGPVFARQWEKANTDTDYNLYWNVRSQKNDWGVDIKKWKQNKDIHSVSMNPLFVNVQKDDFRFLSKKNIKKIKFQPFDLTNIGVYGDKEWKAKAELSPERSLYFKTIVESSTEK